MRPAQQTGRRRTHRLLGSVSEAEDAVQDAFVRLMRTGTEEIDDLRLTLDDSVGMAPLVVLERLTPAERVAFVLHDVFEIPFDEVGATVGRSSPSPSTEAASARSSRSAAP